MAEVDTNQYEDWPEAAAQIAGDLAFAGLVLGAEAVAAGVDQISRAEVIHD